MAPTLSPFGTPFYFVSFLWWNKAYRCHTAAELVPACIAMPFVGSKIIGSNTCEQSKFQVRQLLIAHKAKSQLLGTTLQVVSAKQKYFTSGNKKNMSFL